MGEMFFERLGHFVIRRRRWIVSLWILSLLVGFVSASQIGKRWFESFSIPGYSAYESNQRTLKKFGNGEQAPLVAVFRSNGDVTKERGITKAIARGRGREQGLADELVLLHPRPVVRVEGPAHDVRRDLPARVPRLQLERGHEAGARAIKANAPPGVTAHLTGRDPLQEDIGGTGGPSVLVEVLIGGLGALLVLLFVFGTLPAVAVPLVTALISILTTFSAVYLLTYVTNVSIVVEFLVALVGLGVSVDYSLLMIFRFREELHHGRDVESAIIETMTHAGRSVVVSGSTVAIGLLSMVLLPLPFIRSIGIGGMLIPAIAVLSTLTLTPVLLYWMGHRIDRLRVIPKRIVSADPGEKGFWHNWAEYVVKRPGRIAAAGIAIVVLLLIPAVKLNPSEAEAKNLPGTGDAFQGRDALSAAGLSEGALKPYVVLIEHGSSDPVRALVVKRLRETEGVDGASAPPGWEKGDTGLVEAIPSTTARRSPPAR